ncbi:hypothetical protein F5Y14DRAFT_421642 [Nemania sp. NC0429]|nr:hypothetical protein F5Y14DRAFT_421642 [Nemania sp. NC0429]
MSPPHDEIPSAGFHVAYEPEKSEDALLDVVFVHGLGGHPMRSWQYDGRAAASNTRSQADPLACDDSLRSLLRKPSSSNRRRRPSVGATAPRMNSHQDEPNAPSLVFWPRDLLPIACPEARIITWGYHTIRSAGVPAASQPDIFSHVNELRRGLGELRRGAGAQQRPLVFIAHSLGGIIVKEVLRQAEYSNVESEQDILGSLAAAIFFGCPHRVIGNESLAITAVKMAGACLGVTAESPILPALCGVDNPRWGEAQEAFVRIWHHFNFVVKTYQEEKDSGIDEAIMNRVELCKLGDVRENAESLPADHRTMCQFRSTSDAGFKSLSSILRAIVRDERSRRRELSVEEMNCLRRLTTHRPWDVKQPITESSLGTCRGICSTKEFCEWYRRRGGSNEYVLWLTGVPGSGKTTQLQQIRGQMEKQWKSAPVSVVYCTAEDQSLHGTFVPSSKLGTMRCITTIRSVLSQLFVQDLDLRQRLSSLGHGSISDADLTRFFLDDYITAKHHNLARRTFILVDVQESCDDAYIQELLYCLCKMARNSTYTVCLASRAIDGHVPANIAPLEIENHNLGDITLSVQFRLKAGWDERSMFVRKIAENAGGSFAWAHFATNLLNEIIDGGRRRESVDQVLRELPQDLCGLYEWSLGNLSSKEKADATTIMRWVLLAPEPMVLNDLRMAVRLGRTHFLHCYDAQTTLDIGLPWSMQALQRTGKQFDTPSQFYQWICSRTCGLLEARPAVGESKTQQSLGLQRVYPINDSVRVFFLSGRGFAALSSGRATTIQPDDKTVDLCHYSLLRTILMYLNTSDLSPLVSGYRSPGPKPEPEPDPISKPGVLSPDMLPTWRKNVVVQRKLVTSSYPFLEYAVENLLFHLLSPQSLRYFLPQQAIFNMFASNGCRVWRAWTALLGETDASAILARCKSAEGFLRPEFGASFRLERVFRAVKKRANGDSWFTQFTQHEGRGLSGHPAPRKIGEDGAEDETARKKPHIDLSPSSPRSRGTIILKRKG